MHPCQKTEVYRKQACLILSAKKGEDWERISKNVIRSEQDRQESFAATEGVGLSELGPIYSDCIELALDCALEAAEPGKGIDPLLVTDWLYERYNKCKSLPGWPKK